MKTRHLGIFTALAVSLMALLSGCDDEKVLVGDQVEVSADPDDPHFAYYTMITDGLTKGQPEWDGTEPLPKAIPDLTSVVLSTFVPAKSQPPGGWGVDCIQFRKVPAMGVENEPFPPAARKDKWYVQFHLTSSGGGNYKWWQNGASVYVFLDGTIIKPQRAKAPSNADWLRDL